MDQIAISPSSEDSATSFTAPAPAPASVARGEGSGSAEAAFLIESTNEHTRSRLSAEMAYGEVVTTFFGGDGEFAACVGDDEDDGEGEAG
jgi:hypothetical protein